MRPSDVGLPPKFEVWGPYQKEAVLAVVCSDTRFVILNAPTGIGKSAIYMAVASMLGGRTLILTMTKPLQDQLYRDFKDMGMKVLRGQNNYPCYYFDDGKKPESKLPRCDDGPCHAGVECILRDSGCAYYDAVGRAAKAEIVVENYVHWMTLNRFSEPDVLGKFDNLICDEAHETNNALADFVRVVLDRHQYRSLLQAELPFGATMEEWVEWATEEALPRCRARLEAAKAQASLDHNIGPVKEIAELEGHLADLANARSWKRTDAADPAVWTPGTSLDWVVEEESEKVTFQPVWASGYAEDYLFRWIKKVVLVSATVTPRDAYYLGVFKSQLTYLQYPSPFSRWKRPMFVVPGAQMRRDVTPGELKLWLNQIDRIVEREAIGKRLKGIIHAVSYERAMFIKENSKHSDCMIVHDRRSLRRTVDQFKAMDGPAVLISPSVGTGYDFPGHNCRFQIISKIPFIDNRPAIIRARMKLDKEYLNHVALVALIQMVGRGVRNRDDWCRTYLVDDNWRWFKMATRNMMPKWFRAGIVQVDRLRDCWQRRHW